MVTSRIHILVVLPGFLLRIVLFQALIVLFLVGYFWLFPDAYILQIIIAVVATYVGFRFTWLYFQWLAVEFNTTNQILVIQRGILFTRSERIDLTGAEVWVRQGPIDRRLDRGQLYIMPINGEVRYVGRLTNFGQVRAVLNL